MNRNHERRRAPIRLSSSSQRAIKLKNEASNCIALALDLAPDPFCVELIDEAARLRARAERIDDAANDA